MGRQGAAALGQFGHLQFPGFEGAGLGLGVVFEAGNPLVCLLDCLARLLDLLLRLREVILSLIGCLLGGQLGGLLGFGERLAALGELRVGLLEICAGLLVL